MLYVGLGNNYSKRKGDGDCFSFRETQSFMYVCTSCGVTQVTRGGWPHHSNIFINVVSVVSVPSGVGTRRTRLVLFRCLLVLIRTRLRNERHRHSSPSPYAGIQTVQPSCCKDQNPLLQASKPCNQAGARTRTLCCRASKPCNQALARTRTLCCRASKPCNQALARTRTLCSRASKPCNPALARTRTLCCRLFLSTSVLF